MRVHLGFQLPTWEFPWECEGSFPHTLCTLGSMWCDSRVFFLARNLATPCFGCKPKARVVTVGALLLHECMPHNVVSYFLCPCFHLSFHLSLCFMKHLLPSMPLQDFLNSCSDVLSYKTIVELGATCKHCCCHLQTLILHANVVAACEHYCCIKKVSFICA